LRLLLVQHLFHKLDKLKTARIAQETQFLDQLPLAFEKLGGVVR